MQDSDDCHDVNVHLSRYEKERLRKIEENKALMIELNLLEAKHLLSVKSRRIPSFKARLEVTSTVFCVFLSMYIQHLHVI